MKIQIKNRFSGSVIFETDAESLGAAVLAALAAKANLYGANLYGANLRSANLEGAKIPPDLLASIVSQRTILPDGDLIGWKKLANGTICKLKIPAAAKRVGGLIGRKCRAEFAEVIEGEGSSNNDPSFYYAPGNTVTPDSFDPNPLVECSHGIHFFITRAEAEAYA